MFSSASVMRRSRRVEDEKETVSRKEDTGNKAISTPTNSLEVFRVKFSSFILFGGEREILVSLGKGIRHRPQFLLEIPHNVKRGCR